MARCGAGAVWTLGPDRQHQAGVFINSEVPLRDPAATKDAFAFAYQCMTGALLLHFRSLLPAYGFPQRPTATRN
jgi:hypothetical protein